MRLPTAVQPALELVRVEPDEVAPLDVRDPTLGDEAADVTRLDVEPQGDVPDAQERRPVVILHGTSSMYLYALVMLFRSTESATHCSFDIENQRDGRGWY